MNNLTTRKIVLGMLITLVLAFSVQGIADAIDSFSKPSDSNGTAAARHYPVIYDDAPPTPEHTFSFRVNGAKDNDTVIVTPSNANVVRMTVARAATNEEGTPTSGTTTGTTITFDAPNSDTDDAGTEIGVDEGESDTWSWSGIVTVTYTATTYGQYGLAVSGTTSGVGANPTSLSFNGYVVQGTSNAAQFRYTIDKSASTTTATPQITSTGDSTISVEVVRADLAQEWTQVDLTITGGKFYLTSGSLYLSNRRLYQAPGFTESTRLSVFTEGGGGTIPSVNVRPNSNTTAKVTAKVTGAPGINATHVVTYFYSNAVTIKRISGNNQFGSTNTTPTAHTARRLTDLLVVSVLDGPTNKVSGQDVKFEISIPNTGSAVLRAFSSALLGDSNADGSITSVDDNKDSIIVKTDGSGNAKVYLVPGTSAEEYIVTVSNPVTRVTTLLDPVGFRFTATATAAVRSGADLKIDKDHTNTTQSPQRDAKFGTVNDPLAMSVVIVTDDTNQAVSGNVQVNFQINGGRIYLEPATLDLTQPDYQTLLTTVTNSSGIATVKVQVNNGATATVTAQIVGNSSPRGRHTVTYFWGDPNYDDGGKPAPVPPPAANTITITPSSSTGEPGDEIDISISSSPSTVVIIDSGELDDADFSRLFGTTPFDVTIELPDEEDTYTFSAEAPRFDTARATVEVESEEVALGTLLIEALGVPANGQQTIRINVRDSAGVAATVSVDVTLTGTGINRIVPTTRGSGAAVITVPNTVSVQAKGYRLDTLTLTGAGQQQQQVADEEEEEETVTVSEPDSISIVGPSQRDGTVNEELGAALIVEVVDDDDNGVEDARVIFRVRSGQGRLSEAGSTVSGRAIRVLTDDDGHARANYTPTGGGTHTVKAEVKGVTRTVEFTITTGSAPADETGTRDAGTAPGSISPVVHVGAASRPPMLWVDGGAIYALVGADVQEFAPSVDNALNIAVGGGKVYWTEKTGDAGTINSANLNGSDVTELTSIKAVPMGIAVDTAGSKLYWTNSRGRIQSANLDGSGITNVIPGGLESPMDIALAGGNAYWTQGGNVRFVNLRGTKQIRNISTGTDAAGSLAIGGGKVYWTEMTGDSGGTINSANLNGTGATQLASIKAVPMGIAVDGSRSKLYWSNSRGRIQSANLDGSRIQSVVDGLGSPGELVLSNSIAAPAATPKTPKSTATASKYDVNGDGSVNNADSDAVTVAIAAGATDAKYDVNGDGTVNVFDLVEIIANRDPGAAGAPTLFGMKLSALQIDLIQEQIDLLIATNDRSPAAMRVLVYLQQLLVTARPEKTQLLANYPNPFNPETWIPYELATDTHVRITIYNTQGVVIRSLQFGHQSAGYYVGRDRAAYWDGRNALGEQVASGLYFYQLETDEMSSMRKMVILK